MRNVLILGNSHIGSFKKAWQETFEDSRLNFVREHFTAHWAVTNWLSTGVQFNDRKNFLKYFTYRENHVFMSDLGIKELDFRESLDQEIDVIFIGMGMAGESVHQKWGEFHNFNPGLLTPIQISPTVNKIIQPVSKPLALDIYRAHYNERISFLRHVLQCSHIRKVLWFASPYLCSSVVRKKAGKEQLISGNVGLHYQLDSIARQEVIESFLHNNECASKRFSFVDPNVGRLDSYGSLNDSYMINEIDNHAVKEFYLEEIHQLSFLLDY